MPDPQPPISNEDLAAASTTLGAANDTAGAVNSALSQTTVHFPTPGQAPVVTLEDGPGLHGGITGPLGMLTGAASFEQNRRALGSASTTDEAINAGFGMTNGAATTVGGAVTAIDTVREAVRTTSPLLPGPRGPLPGIATGLSIASGMTETAQGSFNTIRGIANWNNGGEAATQQTSDGITQLGHGALSIAAGVTNNPLIAAGAAGFGMGTAFINAADTSARANGTFGENNHARATTRGFDPAHAGRLPNRSASEAAGDDGIAFADATRPVLGDTGSAFAGLLAAGAMSMPRAAAAAFDSMSGGALSADAPGTNEISVLPTARERRRDAATARTLDAHHHRRTPAPAASAPAPAPTPTQIANAGGTSVREMSAGLPAALAQARASGQTEPTVTVLPSAAEVERNRRTMEILGVTGSGPPVFDVGR